MVFADFFAVELNLFSLWLGSTLTAVVLFTLAAMSEWRDR